MISKQLNNKVYRSEGIWFCSWPDAAAATDIQTTSDTNSASDKRVPVQRELEMQFSLEHHTFNRISMKVTWLTGSGPGQGYPMIT